MSLKGRYYLEIVWIPIDHTAETHLKSPSRRHPSKQISPVNPCLYRPNAVLYRSQHTFSSGQSSRQQLNSQCSAQNSKCDEQRVVATDGRPSPGAPSLR